MSVSIRRAYGRWQRRGRHPPRTSGVLALAGLAGLASWHAPVATVVAVAGAAGLAMWLVVVPRRSAWALVVIAVVGGGLVRSDHAWSGLHLRHDGPWAGWVRVVDDPRPAGPAVRVVVEIEGERLEYWARSRAKRTRVSSWQAGDRVLLRGERAELSPSRRERVAWQHVVGELRLDWVAEGATGTPLDRASNRVRLVLERGAAVLPADDAALFRGLVIGDDTDQPPAMLARFRTSGLSHLTAVSGQNVAFVLAAAGPFLRRLRAGPRWIVTLALIGWFVALTRFEPSIVRAGAMAVLSATGYALGRERAPARLLGVAVIVLLLVDPLLARSVGFWLSVGATTGVSVVGPWLAARLQCLGRLAEPLGVTLGAQAGVAVPSLLVFGRLPLVSVPANLLAVPVAGAVMLYGLPAGLLAGAAPPLAPAVMLPCRLGVRWIDTVAALGARLEPTGDAAWAGWLVLAGTIGLVASLAPRGGARGAASRC